MKNISVKLISMLIIAILALAIMPINSHAAFSESDVIMLQKENGEKIFYIKGMDATDFKYAFSNNKEETPTYLSALKDSNGENVAQLDKDSTFDYLFIQTSSEQSVIELKSIKSITEKEIKDVENLTKIIGVETDGSESKVSKEDDTTVTTTRGKITIKDAGTYQYQLIEVLDKNNSSKELNKTAVELYEQLAKIKSAEKMYDKLNVEITIRDDYKKLIEDAKWEDAKNKKIMQPEDSQEGEKFVVLIQEVKDGKTVRTDVQFMTCGREDDADVEYTNTTVTKQVEKKTKLPVTGEQLALYIAFGLIIVAIIVLAVRMKQKGNQNEE